MRQVTVLGLVALLAASCGGQEVNPFVEAARSLLQDSLGKSEGLGAVVQGLMTSDAGRQLGSLLASGKGIGGLLSDPQVLEGLMSSLNPQQQEDEQQQGDRAARSASPQGGLEGLQSILGGVMPLLMQQGHQHHDEPELEDQAGHQQFEMLTGMFQPVLTQGWELFSKSEMGKGIWEESGLRDTVDMFTDLKGRLKLEEALRSLENPVFRKRWLRSLVNFVANWIKHVSNPDTYKRYMVSFALNLNSFLKSMGYKDKDLFQLGRPFDESLSHVINTVLRGQLGITVNSASYVRPAAKYFHELMAIGRMSSMAMSREAEDKLAETLNREVIEGVLRVWRAYKYSLQVPQCDEYLLCELNRPAHHTGYVVRPGITKAASLVSAWFLSGHTGTAFWKLYNAAVEDYDCPSKFPVDCSGFHEEDIRVTTEYAHNEL